MTTEREAAPNELRVRRSARFRAAPIDNAIVHAQSDGASTSIVVNLVRRHLDWDRMRRKDASEPGGHQFDIHGTEEMTREFEAFLSPYQALKIARDLLKCLATLSPEDRARYRITTIPSPGDDPDAGD